MKWTKLQHWNIDMILCNTHIEFSAALQTRIIQLILVFIAWRYWLDKEQISLLNSALQTRIIQLILVYIAWRYWLDKEQISLLNSALQTRIIQLILVYIAWRYWLDKEQISLLNSALQTRIYQGNTYFYSIQWSLMYNKWSKKTLSIAWYYCWFFSP